MGRVWNSSNDDSRQLLRFAMSAPMLEKDRELDLARRWRDAQDEAALSELTQSYLRLVISMAGRFKNYGLPVSDLIQEGSIGLMEAASRFDPERDLRFSTYASWWIRSSMQDYILRNWSIVRTGTTAAHKTLFFNLRRLRARIQGELDGPMTHEGREQMAAHLGVRVQDVETMEARLSGADRSLNAIVGGEDGDSEWQEFLASEAPLPDEVTSDIHDADVKTQLIRQAMATLSDREALIIRERRLGDESVTLADLGGKLGISKERVRQIEAQAMEKLRKSLLGQVGDPVGAGIIDL